MSYEELSFDSFIDEFKNASKGYHIKKFCFILGAGASKSSGIKTGKELVDIWDKEIKNRNETGYIKWKKDNKIDDENKYSFYSKYYEKRYSREPMDGYNFLENEMDRGEPSIGYIILAYIMNHTNNNIVITTNFDSLVEDAISYYEHAKPLVVGHEAMARYALQRISRPKILKIHRDLLTDPANTSDEVEKLHKNWELPLSQIFSEYNPVFVGYAGNDNSLMDYLISNAEKFKTEGDWQCPFWLIYKDDQLEGKVKEFLHNSDGYYIKHKGFDDVMLSIGGVVGKKPYELPKKKEFLGDAEKRYSELSIAHAKFMEETSKSNDLSDEAKIALSKITSDSEELSLVKKAQKHFQQKEYVKALELYKKLVEKYPTNWSYHNNLGSTLGKLKRYDEAIIEYKEAIKLKPGNMNSAFVYYNLALTLDFIENYEEARLYCEKAIELDGSFAEFHYSLSVILNSLKMYSQAKVSCEKAIELNPDDSTYYHNLGVILFHLRQYEKAKESCEKAIKMSPDDADYYYSLGAIYNGLEKFEEAKKACEKAIELAPDDAQHYYSLSIVLSRMEKYKEAQTACEKAIGLAPNDAKNYNSLGYIMLNLKNYKEAQEAIRKSIELEPNEATYHDSMGEILREMKSYEEAIEEHKKAIEMSSEEAEFHNNFAMTLYASGKYEEAWVEFEKALELEPDNEEFKQNYNELKTAFDHGEIEN